jgi:hypothetical protein
VTFADGASAEPDAVIWTTGFALDHSLVKAPVFDDAGRLAHRIAELAARQPASAMPDQEPITR